MASKNELPVDLYQVFHLFNKDERVMILYNFKTKKLVADQKLKEVLTMNERQYMEEIMKITNMLPFLSQKDLRELANKILEDKESVDVSITMLLPFLNDNDVDEIFILSVEKNEDIHTFLPFVSTNALEVVVNKVLNKEVDLKLTSFLPFLRDEYNDEIFTKILNKELDYNIKPFLPFVSNSKLSEIADSYCNGNEDIPIDSVYPFLSDEDISKVFSYTINKKNKNNNEE